jgi:hypothetical protein
MFDGFFFVSLQPDGLICGIDTKVGITPQSFFLTVLAEKSPGSGEGAYKTISRRNSTATHFSRAGTMQTPLTLLVFFSTLQAAQMTGKHEPNWAEISKISALQATHMTNISQNSIDFCPASSTDGR